MKIIQFDSLDSTNSFLKKNFDIYDNFDVILTNHQTNGYGRFHRKWIDLGEDNVFMSICLKTNDFNQNLTSISQFSALVLAKTIESYSVSPSIKWPNDILINDKKIAGILAESVYINSKFCGVVLGIGMNLYSNFSDISSINQKATALNIEISKKVSKIKFIEKFMKYFESLYAEYLSDGFKIFKNEYISYLSFINKNVVITNNNTSFTGNIIGVNDYGLLIIDINGEKKEISAGDISF